MATQRVWGRGCGGHEAAATRRRRRSGGEGAGREASLQTRSRADVASPFSAESERSAESTAGGKWDSRSALSRSEPRSASANLPALFWLYLQAVLTSGSRQGHRAWAVGMEGKQAVVAVSCGGEDRPAGASCTSRKGQPHYAAEAGRRRTRNGAAGACRSPYGLRPRPGVV